tara:strand:+ start:471 stop:1799 length:1329 start_codon:yes stop_codon:yes gene_type:complete
MISANVNFNIDGVEDCGFVSVTGNWDNWSGWGAHSDNQFSITLNEGSYEFVILCVNNTEGEWWNDIWNNSTIFNAPIGGSCWNGNEQYANYTLNVSGNMTVSYCAGTCDQNCESLSFCGDGQCSEDESCSSCPSDCGDCNDLIYTLVWNDEFDGPEIDENKWNFEIGTGNWGWGNGEHQYYTSRSENAFIEDGKLVIKALNENYQGSNYTSARMTTKNKGDWLYGKIKASIKVPSAGGTWPAFWMMPTNSVYGGWPNSGEMDIMEHYGCNDGEVSATVHNNLYNWNGGIPPTSSLYNTTATSEFHEYAMEWTEDELSFFVDDQWIGSYQNQGNGYEQWPYNQEFFVILNLAIGSHFMPCETEDGLFPQRYEIDYVRVYQLANPSLGDVNQDNSIDILDIVIIIQFIIGDALPTEQQQLVADINQDSSINILDIVVMIDNIVN